MSLLVWLSRSIIHCMNNSFVIMSHIKYLLSHCLCVPPDFFQKLWWVYCTNCCGGSQAFAHSPISTSALFRTDHACTVLSLLRARRWWLYWFPHATRRRVVYLRSPGAFSSYTRAISPPSAPHFSSHLPTFPPSCPTFSRQGFQKLPWHFSNESSFFRSELCHLDCSRH